MILVRDVFRVKFGQAREALAAWKEIGDYMTKKGQLPGSHRVLTDLVGPYYTVVLEMTVGSLAEWEERGRAAMQDPEWRARYQKFTPFAESGYREIFNIVQVLILALLPILFAACAPSSSTESASAAPAAAPAATHEGMPGMATKPTTPEEMIASATSAAPEAISKDATIISLDEKMQITTLRAGTNGWTCIPDGPSPGVDPMCLDRNGVEWMNAWMQHKDPPSDKMAFGYMLMGGSDASNDDPFAASPQTGRPWIDTGPHVMVLNIGNRFEGYPTTAANPKAPYVMFPNTPYAHLMLPVK